MNKEWEIIYKYYNETHALRDIIQGEFSRFCLTHSIEELKKMDSYIRNNLDELFDFKLKEIAELQGVRKR